MRALDRSYQEVSKNKHCRNVVDYASVGTTGAALSTFECDAGEYQCEPSSDFVLRMVHSGAFFAGLHVGTDRVLVNIAAGQFFLTPPYTAIENEYRGSVKGLVLTLPHERVSGLLRDVVSQPEASLRELTLRPFRDEFIRSGLNRLVAVMHSQRHADTVFADAVVLAIWAVLAGHAEKKTSKARHGLADWQMRRVMEKLEAMQEVSLAEMAASANLSPFHFARAFKQTTGLAPHQYQLRLRMERTKDLLISTQLPITEIALSVGYGSGQALARIFRKEMGTSPIEYRRSITA